MPGEPIIATDTTDGAGGYLFQGLPLDDGDGDADYIVLVTDTNHVVDGLTQTFDSDGVGTPNRSAVALSGGSPSNLNQDFGYTAPGQMTGDGLIGDTIFLDVNTSGMPDPGEGLEGVVVKLCADAACSVVIRTTTTDENGHYYFGGLNPNGHVHGDGGHHDAAAGGDQHGRPGRRLRQHVTVNLALTTARSICCRTSGTGRRRRRAASATWCGSIRTPNGVNDGPERAGRPAGDGRRRTGDRRGDDRAVLGQERQRHDRCRRAAGREHHDRRQRQLPVHATADRTTAAAACRTWST